MYNAKYEEMKLEALEAIKETLEDGYSGYWEDLHNEVFNTDYYIIGTYKAKEALNEFDVFDAIEKVQEYEKFNFGEIYTDISDPEKLVNMLYYIIGEEVLYSLDSYADKSGYVEEEEALEVIDEINSALED